MYTEMLTTIPEEILECIQECQDCHEVCLESVAYCLEMGGKHANPEHISLLLDCAEICQVNANFMLRSSPLYMRTCELVAEVCEACADSCEELSDDQVMQNCAEFCLSCSESCRDQAGVS